MKSIFDVDKGKLLRHVVSKDGISIDPERIHAIKDISPPKEQSTLRSFFGKINLVRTFVPNFVGIIKPMNDLLKKDTPSLWNQATNRAFE